MKIFIPSYTYIYDRHLRVFDYFQKKDDLVFILPKVWKARGGKLIVKPPEKPEFKVIQSWSPFYHSHYPAIRGLLKGWMPFASRILKKMSKPGDVLASFAEPNLITAYFYGRLAKKLGLKHVMFTWQNISYEKRLKGLKFKITNWLIKKNLELSDGILCGTRQAFSVLEPYLNGKIKTAVIPQSGVDAELFKPGQTGNFRNKNGLENKTLFLFGAVFDERKGVLTAIEAFSKTRNKIKSCHLVMIGMGKLWSQAQELAKKLGIEKNIIFINWLPNHELSPLLSSADIFIHPSEPYKDWEEQYGWMILQASASGLPVIATKVGAIPEAVIDGKTGILVEPKNPSILAEKMIYLAQNPEIRKEMGQEGRNYVENKYSHRVIAGKMENFLRNL